jgi:hypothetical protein
MVMMAMVMAMAIAMAIAMAMAMEMVRVPEALRQVGWLRQRQRQRQTFHRLRAFHWPKLPLENTPPSEVRLSQAGSQAGSQAAIQECSQRVYSTSETSRQ